MPPLSGGEDANNDNDDNDNNDENEDYDDSDEANLLHSSPQSHHVNELCFNLKFCVMFYFGLKTYTYAP